ncbi:MAG TPA: Uma2 family endonuclease [Vicinamibacterales bacterium]|jgi:Uma2 family endonuclease|nr:Uma2 family endonuclease [Vicinamibacterales bacterium]
MSASDPTRPPSAGVKLTYDDLVHFPDDGKRHELIDGEHYVTPSPDTRHQRIVLTLANLIWNFLEANRVGEVFGAPLDVVFSDIDVVEPDLLFVSQARMDVVTTQNIQGAPDLVVEVGSPGTRRRDEKIKHRLYGPPRELTLDKGDMLTTPLLPGLVLPLTRIFSAPHT